MDEQSSAARSRRTPEDLAAEYEQKGAIFATVQGLRVMISHDEEATGLFAWPDGVDGATAIASFGEDWTGILGTEAAGDEGWPLVARWLNTDGAQGSLTA